MSDQKPKRDYTSHQQKIIKRYYQKLMRFRCNGWRNCGELYPCEGKKKEKPGRACSRRWKTLVPAFHRASDEAEEPATRRGAGERVAGKELIGRLSVTSQIALRKLAI